MDSATRFAMLGLLTLASFASGEEPGAEARKPSDLDTPSVSVSAAGPILPVANTPAAPMIVAQRELAPGLDLSAGGLGDGQEIQNAPGAARTDSLTQRFRALLGRMPDYVYDPEYYDEVELQDRYTVGAKPLADYAPRGYIERDFQTAPGVPEYTPLPTPVQITEEEREKFVVGGMYPGSYLAPGTNTSFRLRGFVRLGGTFDFNPIGSRDQFVTRTIPIPQQVGQDQNFSARFSRITLDTWTPTRILDWNMHTLIEFDFFGGEPPAIEAGNPARLRFAFGDFGYFRLGQQNTVFMDSSSFPSVADFAGPRGLVNLRRPGARVTLPITDSLFWAAAVEQPFSDITTLEQGVGVQDIPDLASHLRYEADYGHVQLSTIGRSIGYRPEGESVTRRFGWGLNTSSNFHPWAMLLGENPVRTENPSGLVRSRFLLQYAFGWGIARMIQDTRSAGLDGSVTSAGGFDTLYAVGWSASYEHWFNAHFLTNVTYSADYTSHTDAQPGNTYAGAKYLAASFWYIPVTNASLGIEFLWGEREDLDGSAAQARRIQTVAQYNF